LGEFDVIISSDLLYESEHVDLLTYFLQQHAAAQCEIILVDPGRGNHARFSKKMVALGFTHSQEKPDTHTYLEKPFGGQVLHYLRKS
jgi:predicted nicotinamide N-methyase